MASASRNLKLEHCDWAPLLAARDCIRRVITGSERNKRRRTEQQEWTSVAHHTGACLHRWLTDGSWGFCGSCSSVFPRELSASAFGVDREPCESTVCSNCLGPYVVPEWQAVPGPLMNLSVKEACALRPVVVSMGDSPQGHRQGYLRHRQAMRFSWKPCPVEFYIARFVGESRQRLDAAFTYLQDSGLSAYRDFLREHREWLAGEEQGARLPVTFLLRACASPARSWVCDAKTTRYTARSCVVLLYLPKSTPV